MNDVFLWHLRLIHASCGSVHLVAGTYKSLDHFFQQCIICSLSKQTRSSFPLSNNQTSNAFDLVHLDVRGPYRTPTYDDFRYFLMIVDDFSHCTWVFLMQNKTEVFGHIRTYLQLIQTQFSRGVKVI